MYRFIQLAGGIYLAFIGWSIWRGAARPFPDPNARAPRATFRKAFFLGLSNPKVIVFFGAIVGTAFPQGTPGLLRWGTVPIVLIIETLWYGSLALLFGVTPVRNHYRRIKAVFERSCGGLLIVFGAKVTWSGAHDSELPS